MLMLNDRANPWELNTDILFTLWCYTFYAPRWVRHFFKMASKKLVGYDSAEDSDSTEITSQIREQREV